MIALRFKFLFSFLCCMCSDVITKKTTTDFSRAQQEERLKQIKNNNAVLEHTVTCQDHRCRTVKCDKMKVKRRKGWGFPLTPMHASVGVHLILVRLFNFFRSSIPPSQH